MPVLTTLEKLKTHLGIPQTDLSENALLNQILAEVDISVLKFCKRGFSSAQATEYYDGTGRELLILKRRPVTAVLGVWVDSNGWYGQAAGAFATSTAWTVGEDFASPSLAESEENGGMLIAIPQACGFEAGTIPRYWPEGRGNIKVTYTAGYVTIPDDLALAVHQLAATVRKGAEHGTSGPIGSETFGEYSYSLLTGDRASGIEMVAARGILANYRDVAL